METAIVPFILIHHVNSRFVNMAPKHLICRTRSLCNRRVGLKDLCMEILALWCFQYDHE